MTLSQTNGFGSGQPPKTRIVILGGGFGGIYTARHLERLCKRRQDVEIVLLSAEGEQAELGYDQLVLALGGMTNRRMIPGSEHAFTFKTLADAFLLRNHIIERFERADVELDPERKRRQLTFVIIGGGLVGVELFGELTAFADGIAPYYKHVNRDEVRFILLQADDHLMPEIDPELAEYGARVLGKRCG